MTTDLLKVILADTFTKNAAEKKLLTLKNHLLDTMFTTSPKKEAKSENPELATWLTKVNKKALEDITNKNVYAVFDKAESELKAVEPLVLYLPYELPEEEMTAIGLRLRRDYGENFLMEVTIDPNLIAGCALSFKGIYKDYSVKQRIADNKQAILESFKQYVKH